MRVLTSTPAAAVCILALELALLGAADRAAGQPTEEQVAAIKSSCRSDYMSYCWSVPRGGAEAMQCLKKNVAKLSSACQQAVNAAVAPAAPSAPAASAAKAPETPAAPPASESAAAANAAAKVTAPPGGTNSASVPVAKSTATSSQPETTAKAALPTPGARAPAPNAATPAAPPAEGSEAAAEEPPSEPAATTAAVPPSSSSPLGFIPPRKKLMVLRNCRQDLDTYCADVPYGDGRQLSCLESNLAKLTPDCQGALARLAR
jgi:hypothetical protein